MNINIKKQEYLNLQLLANIGFIIALIISLLLTYDKKLSLEHKTRLFNVKLAKDLSYIQTLLVFTVSITYLYINYKQYNIAKIEHSKSEKIFVLQIETSVLAIISAVIGLYIVYKNNNDNGLSINQTEI